MIKMHYGIPIDTEKPTTGVAANNRIEFLGDELVQGIDLAWEEHCQECRGLCHGCSCNHDGPDESCTCGSWTLERHGTDSDHDYDPREGEHDGCGPQEQGDVLIGSWKKGDDGLYEPDETGEYAAIVRETVTQVIWSKYTEGGALCSPCYPGQVDLDTPGKFLAYTLPKGLWGENR
jgi:hypothetical protein